MSETVTPECFQTLPIPDPSPPHRKHFSQLLSPEQLTIYIARVYKDITTPKKGPFTTRSFPVHMSRLYTSLPQLRENYRSAQTYLANNLRRTRVTADHRAHPQQPPPYTVRDFFRDLIEDPRRIPTDLDTYALSQINSYYRSIFARLGGVSAFDQLITSLMSYTGSRYAREDIPALWVPSPAQTLAAFTLGVRNLIRNHNAWLKPDGTVCFRTPPLPLTGTFRYTGNRVVTAGVTIPPLVVSFRPPYAITNVYVRPTALLPIYRCSLHFNHNEEPLQPYASYKKYPHPHVHRTEACMGEASPIVSGALGSLDFLGAADALQSMLGYYNDASPYLDLRAYIKADDLGLIPGTNRLKPRTTTDPDTGEVHTEAICARCEQVLDADDPLTDVTDRGEYCSDCTDNYTFVCPNCSQTFDTAAGYRFRTTDDGERSDLHCSSCRSDLSTSCDNCGDRYADELLSGPNNNLCPNCYSPDDEEDDDFDDENSDPEYPQLINMMSPLDSRAPSVALNNAYFPHHHPETVLYVLCIPRDDQTDTTLSLPENFGDVDFLEMSDGALEQFADERSIAFIRRNPSNPNDPRRLIVGTREAIYRYLNECSDASDYRTYPDEVFYLVDVDAFPIGPDGNVNFSFADASHFTPPAPAPVEATPVEATPEPTPTIAEVIASGNLTRVSAPEDLYYLSHFRSHEVFTFNTVASDDLRGCVLTPCETEFRGSEGLAALVGTLAQLTDYWVTRYGYSPRQDAVLVARHGMDPIPTRIIEAQYRNAPRATL